ncbi:Bicupin, oxalate decarboxylase/oxidase [Peniophora sp. CONT]|nr:Bicupin, oxalate decarboxylase/oxidase [Peniophora sp. CONT]
MARLAISLSLLVYWASLSRALPGIEERAAASSLLSNASATASGAASATSAAASPLPASATVSAPPEFETVPPASSNPNAPIFPVGDANVENPQATRGSLGSSILGPNNLQVTQQNPDFLAPPTTDNGDVMNAKWPFAMSHNRLQTGGWARQQNIEVMPIATQMAGVNMRLEKGAIRELHWHKTSEWAYVLKGTTQITAIDQDGKNFLANVGPGDLWYFPPGIPHSLQATGDDPDGTEFLLIFDEGDFSEGSYSQYVWVWRQALSGATGVTCCRHYPERADDVPIDATFLLTDWMAHVPMDVLSKSFGLPISAFDHIPSKELYIFPAEAPTGETAVSDPAGQIPNPFSYALSQDPVTPLNGGTVKIVDSTKFKASTTIAAADVTVEPGAIRELHWHPTQDEWTFFISGQARMTLFAAQSNSRTFDYQAGDIGYVPASFGHYVENVGNDTLHFLEIFKSDRFQDISLSQWMALTPPALVKAHLGFDDATIAMLNKTKQTVIQG